MVRKCSKAACSNPAVATLTFDYRESSAVVGPLAPQSYPGTYDLCRDHAERLSVPRGWEVVRLSGLGEPVPDEDDLNKLAEDIRRIGLPNDDDQRRHREQAAGIVELNRRGHLRVIADSSQAD